MSRRKLMILVASVFCACLMSFVPSAPGGHRAPTREEMIDELAVAIEDFQRRGGAEVIPADREYCSRLVDEHLLHTSHPIWSEFGYSRVYDMPGDEAQRIARELSAGTRWEGVKIHDGVFHSGIELHLGKTSFDQVAVSAPGWLEWIQLTMLGVAGLLALTLVRGRGTTERRSPRRRATVGAVLDWFAWFSTGETGEMLMMSAADLRRHVSEMRKKRPGRLHVLAVRTWITVTTISPILADAVGRFAMRLPFVGAYFRAVAALLGKIDPPQLR